MEMWGLISNVGDTGGVKNAKSRRVLASVPQGSIWQWLKIHLSPLNN